MAITAPSNIGEKAVAPISDSLNISDKVVKEFQSTYNAINAGQNNDDSKKGEQEVQEGVTREKARAGKTVPSELFMLLKNYHFEDFMKLALSEDGARLNLIIKRSREERGVSHMLPISAKYKGNKQFVDWISSQYKNVGWLMDSKPGQTYSTVW